MILKIIDSIIDSQIENGVLVEDDASVYRYGYTLVVEAIINLIVTIIVGLVLGELLSAIFFMLAFIPLRSYCGGYHAPKGWICIILSNVVVIVVILLERSFIQSFDFLIIIELCCIAIIILLAPIQSPSKKINDNEKKVYKKYAKIVLAVEMAFGAVLLSIGYNQYVFIIVMAHAVQALSLIIVWPKVKIERC